MTPPTPTPIDDEDKARELARVAVLRIVVWVLGAILVALAIVVFSTLILRAVKGKDAAAPGAAAPRVPAVDLPATVTAALPPGGRVVSTALGEGRLAVTVEAPDGTTVILFDLATRAEAGRVRLIGP
ncbi:MAG: DUF6476 family protein [Alsobacter sp.]